MSHTPGPWKSYPTPNDLDFSHEIEGICSVNMNINSEANASLIAAAPDLLAFADSVVTLFSAAYPKAGLHLDMDKASLLNAASDVIKKARGE